MQRLYQHISTDAFHNSQERSKEVDIETSGDITNQWTSRLQAISSHLISSGSSRSDPSVFAQSVTEGVLKDVFTWLYDPSTPFLIMWIPDEGRTRTSLIAQVIADVLYDRGELSALYFACPSSGKSRIDLSCVIPTIAYQL